MKLYVADLNKEGSEGCKLSLCDLETRKINQDDVLSP